MHDKFDHDLLILNTFHPCVSMYQCFASGWIIIFHLEQLLEDFAKDSLKHTNDRLHVCENSFSDE